MDASPDAPPRHPRVLIVDDEPGVRSLLERMIHGIDADARVDTAADGPQAMDLLRGGDFDLVIADQRLPHSSGIEILAWARRNQPLAERVLISAYLDHDVIVAAINTARAAAVIPKPWDVGDLSRRVTSLLAPAAAR